MSFICIDADTHKSVKVLSDRLNRTIKQFFLSQYSTAERAAVQRVIMDMNASYQAFVHELFPNAELIIDRFHIIQLMGRTINGPDDGYHSHSMFKATRQAFAGI